MQGSDSFRLVVRRGPQPNQVYELNKDLVTLGRDITNDIVINDPEVSRHHLRFVRGSDGYTLEDLGSTNGTFVNGQRLTSARPLNNGDMVGLGETVTLGYERVRPMGAADPGPGATVPNQAQQPQVPYVPQGQQPYYPQQPQAPQDYGYNQPDQYGMQQYSGAAPQAPAVPGYEYDPYAVRDDEPRNTARWIAIGCLGLSVFCCCTTGIGLVIIDTLNLWYQIPIISTLAQILEPIARALGFI